HIDLDGALPSGRGSAAHGCAEFEQERARCPRLWRLMGELRETSHFLQQLQHFNSCGHALCPHFCRKSRAMAQMRKKRHFFKRIGNELVPKTVRWCMTTKTRRRFIVGPQLRLQD